MIRRLVRAVERRLPGASRSLGWEFLLSALTFPASILANRALGAADRGQLALAILVPTTIFTLGGCQWDRLLKGLVTSKQAPPEQVWASTLRFAITLSVLWIPVGIAASYLLENIPAAVRPLSALYCANFPVYFLGGCLAALFVASGSVDHQYLMRVGLQVSYLLLLLVLLVTGHVTVASMVVTLAVVHAVSLVVGLRTKGAVVKRASGLPPLPYKPLAKAFLPNTAEVLATKSDAWAYSLFGTIAGLGQYVAVTALMMPISLVSNALTSSSTARLDWTSRDAVRTYLRRATVVLAALTLPVLVATLTLGPALLETVLGRSFRAPAWFVALVAAVALAQAAGSQFHAALQLSGAMSRYLAVQSADSLIRIPVVLVAGWRLGEVGILTALLITSLTKAFACGLLLAAPPAGPRIPGATSTVGR